MDLQSSASTSSARPGPAYKTNTSINKVLDYFNTTTVGSIVDKANQLPLPFDEEKRIRYWEDCNLRIFDAPTSHISGVYCNRTGDVFGCWPDTPAGQYATIACPDYVSYFRSDLTVTRQCLSNGTWIPFRKSLYKQCVDTEGTYRAIITYYAGYTLSIVACTIAFIIFATFRSLRCPRVTIHQNLFMTYIWTGIFWILYYALQGGLPPHDAAYETACKAVHVLATYLTLCSYCWMFCEGLYLYMNLVFAFINAKKVLKACIFIGWTTPVPFVIAYTVGMTYLANAGSCWESPSFAIWYTQGLACLTLVLNLFFVSHIVYILITKMRDVQTSEQQQIRKVAKAILVLVPLLGLQYLLTPIAPDARHKFYGLYVIMSALIAATQGFFVAVVFCFVNGDVTKTVRRKMASHRLFSRLVRPSKHSMDMTSMTRYSTVRQSIDVRPSVTPAPEKPIGPLTSAVKHPKSFGADDLEKNGLNYEKTGTCEENGTNGVTDALLDKDASRPQKVAFEAIL